MPEKRPSGWVKTTLGEVCAMNPRTPFDESVSDHTEVSFVPMAAVEEESGRLDASQIRTLGSVRHGYTSFRENDVIFAKITPCMENGKIALATGLKNGLAFGSTEFFVFRPYEGVLPRFILYFLLQQPLRESAVREMTGASGQKRVPSQYLLNYEFWLPPTREQERVVAKLDASLLKLERAQIAARRAQERLRGYRDAVLTGAITGELTKEWRKTHKPDETGLQFLKRLSKARRAHWEQVESKRLTAAGRPPRDDKWKAHYNDPIPPRVQDLHELPNTWAMASIEQLLRSDGGMAYGILKPGNSVSNGVPMLRIVDISKDGTIATEGIFHVSHALAEEFKRTQLETDDVLLSVMGTIGRTAIVPSRLHGGNVNRAIAVLKLIDKKLSPFVFLVLRSSWLQELVARAKMGSAQQRINLSDLRWFPVPLPSPSEQAEIVSQAEHRLSAADSLNATLSRQLDHARVARQSLLHEAFSGRLIVQNLNDKSAAGLLDRIRVVRESEAEKPKGKRMSQSKSKSIRRPLLDVLREHKKPMTPEMLFRDSGFEAMFNESEEQQDVVDAFYKELRKLTDKPARVSERKDSKHEVMLKVLP